MRGVIRDAVLAARRMWTHPLVSLASVLTFALGIGANVAMFSVAWPVMFAPLPFPDEARLTLVSLTYERNNSTFKNPVSRGDYLDLRTAALFEPMAAFYQRTSQLNLTGLGKAEQVSVASVTPEFFSVLGVRPVLGSLPASQDANTGNVIILNERAWRTRFGSDPGIVGRTLRFDGVPYEVLGVAPASTGLGTGDADAWQLTTIDATNRMRGAYFLGIVARLKPDVTLERANDELAAIMARAAIEFPQFNRTLSARADLYRDEVAGPMRPSLILLLSSAAMVLLIATINLTGLQRARDLERSSEQAVRRALGASRWHLGRHALAEALTLAAVGGVLGTFIAVGIVSALVVVAPSFGWQQQLPTSKAVVAAFTVVLTCLSGAAIGMWPAWQASRQAPGAMWSARTMTLGRVQARMRSGVVATQVALTAVLLVVAALVAVSQRNVLALETGFDPGFTRVADLNVPTGRYASVRELTQFFDTLTTRVKALPGVTDACVANEIPLDRAPGGMTYVAEGTERLVSAWPNTISPACVDVLRLRLLAGRRVTNDEPIPSVMVSASMAKALFSDGRNPIGQRVHFGVPTAYLLTIVGVLEDIRDGALETSHGRQVWMPQSLGHFPPARILVRYASPGAADDAALRAIVNDLAPDLALARPRALADVVLRATANRRFVLFLLSGFAVVAVLLCAIGLYGVLAHSVGQRTQEIGIRMALGARPAQVLQLVLTQVTLAAGAGLLVGLLGARALSDTVRSLLYGVVVTDPRIYVGVGAVVLTMAALAVWSPTRRAVMIDPKTAMRAD